MIRTATLLLSLLATPLAAASFTFNSIDGGTLDLDDWKGQPVLVVNTASRMQSEVAAPGQIVISRATFDRVRDQVSARPLGERRLRGRSGLVEVFEVDT